MERDGINRRTFLKHAASGVAFAGSSAAAPTIRGETIAPRSPRNLSEHVVNVRDPRYGARGNGSTDDTAAIQAAANTIGGNGGVLLFPQPEVEYKVSREITISNAMVVQGPGHGHASGSSATIRTTSASANVFNVTTANGVVFRDLAFGSSSRRRADGAAIRVSSDGLQVNKRSRFENLYFQGESTCLQFDAARFWVVRDCVFDQFGRYGIKYSNASFADQADNAIMANVFVGAPGRAEACFYSESAAATWILGNKLFGAAYGIFHNAKDSTGTFQIVGNSFEEQTNAHILFRQLTSGKILGQININANEFSILDHAPTSPTLYLVNAERPWIYRVNICDNIFNHRYSSSVDAIRVLDGKGVIIANNVIDHTNQPAPGGISTGGNARNVQILDNIFVNMSTAQRYKNGVANAIVRDLDGLAFENLGDWRNGSTAYITDGTFGSNPLVGGGTGAFARRINNRWVGT